MDTQHLKNEMRITAERARELADTVRLELHLAKMESRDRWEEFGKRVLRAEQQFAGEIAQTSRRTWQELVKATRALTH